MGWAYSLDLRERVVAAFDAGARRCGRPAASSSRTPTAARQRRIGARPPYQFLPRRCFRLVPRLDGGVRDDLGDHGLSRLRPEVASRSGLARARALEGLSQGVPRAGRPSPPAFAPARPLS